MTDANPISPSFIARVKGILLQPKAEWETIDREHATVKDVFVPYALILAAIGPICSAIGSSVIGVNVLGTVVKTPILSAVVGGVFGYILALASVFILSLVINALAASFGGVQDKVKATQVAVYSMTASWLAAVFGIVPILGLLAIVGLYSLYLLYLGLPRLMKTPQDKAIIYTVVVVIVGFVLSFIASLIVGALTLALGGASAISGL